MTALRKNPVASAWRALQDAAKAVPAPDAPSAAEIARRVIITYLRARDEPELVAEAERLGDWTQ